MGFFRLWRQNLAALVSLVVVAGLVAVPFWAAHKHAVNAHRAKRRAGFVTFVVTGSATGGVFVGEEEAGVREVVVAKRARLPFRARVSTADGSASYELQATLLGAGRIRCTVRVGSVVAVKEASGADGICTPAVSLIATRYGGGGWVAG